MNGKKVAIGTAAVAVLALGGGGVAIAAQQANDTPNEPAEQQATGPNVEKAKSVALDRIKGGRVTGAEVGDEESYYEIEVTRDDGSQVDVQLDRDFKVVDQAADHESPDGADGPNEGGPDND